MTFSEYISSITVKDYIEYCKRNNITPEMDVEIPVPKLCALVLTKTNPKAKTKHKNAK